MIVIAKNTEEKLFEELQKCRKEAPSQRCFYIELSKADLPKKELFERFLSAIQNIPNSYMAQIYICQDRDVFILMTGFMQRQFTAFLKKFAEDLDAPALQELGSIFEVGVHWTKLETLCQEKIENIDKKTEKEAEEKRKEEAEKIAFETLSRLDTNMISTIAARREARDQPVALIVDDDQLCRTLAGNVLREKCQPVFAQNGQSALHEFVDCAPDIVFLDIGMPDISGHDVLDILFQIDPEAYIIMFSGRKDKENIMRALETGAQGFLGKPFSRDNLYQHVEQSPFIKNKIARRPPHESATG